MRELVSSADARLNVSRLSTTKDSLIKLVFWFLRVTAPQWLRSCESTAENARQPLCDAAVHTEMVQYYSNSHKGVWLTSKLSGVITPRCKEWSNLTVFVDCVRPSSNALCCCRRCLIEAPFAIAWSLNSFHVFQTEKNRWRVVCELLMPTAFSHRETLSFGRFYRVTLC